MMMIMMMMMMMRGNSGQSWRSEAIPNTDNNVQLVKLKQTQQNCLGAPTTNPHSCARRSISAPNELAPSVEEGW